MVTISVVVQLESMAQSFLLRGAMVKEEERNHVKHKAIVGRERTALHCIEEVLYRNRVDALMLTPLTMKCHVFCELSSKTYLPVRWCC